MRRPRAATCVLKTGLLCKSLLCDYSVFLPMLVGTYPKGSTIRAVLQGDEIVFEPRKAPGATGHGKQEETVGA